MQRFPLSNLLWLFVMGFALVTAPTSVLAQDDAAAAPAADVENKDRYTVPDGDLDALGKFIEDLQNFQPSTTAEVLEYRRKFRSAVKEAATKILELDPEQKSEVASKASRIVLQDKVQTLGRAPKAEQEATFNEVKKALASAKTLGRSDVQLAMGVAQTLEYSGNPELAATAYRTLGELLAKSDDELASTYGEKMVGAARRMDLPGNEMRIEGETVEGKPFDWSSYRGKVVLVDFWATWCGPCIAELPNVKAMYEKYHEKGFDVVGISLDSDKARLEAFLKKEQIPWVTLFEQSENGWDNPNANYYGVLGIPTVILVDKEGKVVSLQARGPKLGQLLEQMLGESEDDNS